MPKLLLALIALALGQFALPLRAIADSEAPTCKIKAFYTQPGPAGVMKFTFVIEAFDNVAVKRLQYRAAVNGAALGAWRNYPYVPGTRITYTVACTAFQVQFRSVDTSGNFSPAVSQSFRTPFPRRPIPRPEPFFKAPALFTASGQSNVTDVAMSDVNGDGHADIALAEFDSQRIKVHIAGGALLSGTQIDLPFSQGPQALAFGRIFGPNGSAANDARPDIVAAVENKVRILINNGQDGTNVGFSSSDVRPFIETVSTFYYAVAAGDVNGDGFDDIIAGGVFGFPTFGTVDVILNKGIEPNGAGGFRHAGFEVPVQITTGLRIEQVLLADLDDDGDLDIVAADNANKIVATLLNNGDGTFAAPVEQTTLLKPEAIALGDMTNDGYVDIAVFGSEFTGTSTRAGFQLLRNTADPSDNFGTFVDAGVQIIATANSNNPNIFFPGDIAIADVTLDGIPDVVIANHYGDTIDIYRFAVIRDPDTGEFQTFVQEGLDQLGGIDGPMKFAVGDINGDGKPDLAVGNFSTDQLAIFLNQKGNTDRTNPLSLTLKTTSLSFGNAFNTLPDDEITIELTYSNDSFNEVTNALLTCTLPSGLELPQEAPYFTDVNGDGVDDNFGFRLVFSGADVTAVSWDLGTLNINDAGVKRFRVHVPEDTFVGTKFQPFKAKLRVDRGSKTAVSRAYKSLSTLAYSVTIDPPTKSTALPGEVLRYVLRVKNRALAPAGISDAKRLNYFARNVKAIVNKPDGTAISFSGGGDTPAFIEPGNSENLITRIDALTGATAVAPRVAPFLSSPTTTINPRVSDDRQLIGFWLGAMAPGEEAFMRFSIQIPYDQAPGALGNLLAFGKFDVTQKAKGNQPEGAANNVVGAPLTIGTLAANAPRPILTLSMRQETAGYEQSGIGLVTKTAGAVLDSTPPATGVPALKTNQIRYFATYENRGGVTANSLRATFSIPNGTKLDKNSLVINGAKIPANQVPAVKALIQSSVSNNLELHDVPDVFEEYYEQKFLILDLPFLDALGGANSKREISFTCTLTPSFAFTNPTTGRPAVRALAVDDEFLGFGFLACDSLLRFQFSNPLRARVTNPVLMTKLKIEGPPDLNPPPATFSYLAIFKNDGGLEARDFEVFADIPGGAMSQGGFFRDDSLARVGGIITEPPLNSTSGTVRWKVPRVAPGALVRCELVLAPNTGTLETNLSTTPLAGRVVPFFEFRDRTTPTAALAPAPLSVRKRSLSPTLQRLVAGDLRSALLSNVRRIAPSPWNQLQRSAPLAAAIQRVKGIGMATHFTLTPGTQAGRVNFLVKAPRVAEAGGFITYTIVCGNDTTRPNGAGSITLTVPAGTTAVEAGPSVSLTGSAMASFFDNNRQVTWGVTPDANSAFIVTLKVQVDAGRRGVIYSPGIVCVGDQSGYWTANKVVTVLRETGQGDASLRSALTNAMLGPTAEEVTADADYNASLDALIANDGAVIGTTGHTVKVLPSGAILMALGAGNIVAAGGGNIADASLGDVVANDGAGIVAGGGGNIVAAGGGNIVAAGGGNVVANDGAGIVAAGGGNLMGIKDVFANLNASNLRSAITGPGQLLIAGGAALIGSDGASLLDNVTGAVVGTLTPDLFDVVSARPELLVNTQGSLVGQPGGPLVAVNRNVALKASTGVVELSINPSALIGHDGATLIGDGGGTLIGGDGAGLIGDGGGTLIGDGGGTLVGLDGASILVKGNGIVGAGGGNVLSHNGNAALPERSAPGATPKPRKR